MLRINTLNKNRSPWFHFNLVWPRNGTSSQGLSPSYKWQSIPDLYSVTSQANDCRWKPQFESHCSDIWPLIFWKSRVHGSSISRLLNIMGQLIRLFLQPKPTKTVVLLSQKYWQKCCEGVDVASCKLCLLLDFLELGEVESKPRRLEGRCSEFIVREKFCSSSWHCHSLLLHLQSYKET